MKRLRINARLLVAASLLIAATTFSLGYMGVHISQRFLKARFEQRMAFLAKYLALNSELGILIDDRRMLERLAANLLSEEDVLAVTIFGRGEEQLAHVAKERAAAFSVVESPVRLKRNADESLAFSWPANGERTGGLLGKIRVKYSTESIGALSKSMRDRFIWLSGGLAALAACVFYFISRSVTAPVTQLAQAARQVAAGDLERRAPAGGVPETRELAAAFNSMLDSLERNRKALEKAQEKITRQKTLAEMGKFSLMVAHEVKNPLGIIKSSLDILKADPAVKKNETVIFYMEDEIRRLNRLIEDFLGFARPTEPSFRQVDLNALMEETVNRFAFRTANSETEMYSEVPSEPCRAEADPDLLTRALSNIIQNALDANSEGGRVQIRVTAADRTWTVEIIDQGDGIQADALGRIFEPFFTTRSKGTGLGLAYAEQVVGAHGGNIDAENIINGGALFRVRLPLN